MITFIPLGGADSIGASAYLFVVDDSLGRFGILVDIGVYNNIDEEDDSDEDSSLAALPLQYTQIGGMKFPIMPNSILQGKSIDDLIIEKAKNQLPNIHYLRSLNLSKLWVVVTHSHADHMGAIPLLCRIFPEAEIFMTAVTRDVSIWGWKQYLGLAKREGFPIFYSEEDIEQVEKRSHIVKDDGKGVDINPFSLSFFSAGHIHGAVSVKITARDDHDRKSVFVSSDICFHNQLILKGAPLLSRKDIGPIDYVLAESTYGRKNKSIHSEASAKFAHEVASHLQSGGKVIVPALAIGRAQEAFAVLEAYGITLRWPVWVDGSAQEVSQIYIQHGILSRSIANHFVISDEHREAIAESSDPCVVIAPNGMAKGGRSAYFIKRWGRKWKNFIAFVSYQASGTPGANLVASRRRVKKVVRIVKETVAVIARVEQYALSAHAAGSEIAKMVDRLEPRSVFLVHGNQRDTTALKNRLADHSVIITKAGTPYLL
jgi:Cft2 family RNA processing exonuclease